MDPQLVAALDRQNHLLERNAFALERMAPAVAPNYHAALESFANYDWSAIGAEVAARAADGPMVTTLDRASDALQHEGRHIGPKNKSIPTVGLDLMLRSGRRERRRSDQGGLS